MLLTFFVCSDAFVCLGESPLRAGGATGACAIAAAASASSASADKERNNDMSLTYSEWKNPGIPMNQPLADSQLYFGPLNDLNPGREGRRLCDSDSARQLRAQTKK